MYRVTWGSGCNLGATDKTKRSAEFAKRVAYLSLDACVVAYLIQVVGRNAGLYSGSRYVEDLTGKPAHLAHGLLACLVEEVPFRPAEPLLALGDAGFRPVWVSYRLGDGAARREGIDGTDWAGVTVCREGVVRFGR